MNEAELRQAMSALELYRAQLESIAENQQLVQMSLEELARAKETLVRYKEAQEGSELLVPIGGNSFVFAKVATNSKAIVGIGSGVSVEKSMDEAVQTMESRANELMDTMKKLNERRVALEDQANQLSMAVQQEMQALQQRP